MSEIEQRLAKAAQLREDSIAVSSEHASWSFNRLVDAVGAVAEWLRGSPDSLVVCIALPGGPEFTALQLGAMAAGCVAMPVPRQATAHEAAKYFGILVPDIVCVLSLTHGRAILHTLAARTLVVVLDDEPPHTTGPHFPVVNLRQIEQGTLPAVPLPASHNRLPRDARLIQFTSGSTGWPKALLLSESNLLANQDANAAHLARFERLHVFSPVPQFHAMGNAVVLERILSGGSVHLANAFLHGEHFARMNRYRCAAMIGSPHYFRMLRKLKSFCHQSSPWLDFVTIGTDRVDIPLVQDLRHRFPDLTVFCRYGLSEAVGALAIQTVASGEQLTCEGQLGDFVAGVEWCEAQSEGGATEQAGGTLRVRCAAAAAVQVLPGGELRGVLNDEGYLDTGDVAVRDAHGRLILLGRESQFIKSNGYQINPAELEEVVRQAPGVRDVVVVGLPDPVAGQKIVACVVLDGTGDVQPKQILGFCAHRLSRYKMPQELRIDVEVPMTHSGKPARQELVGLLMSEHRIDGMRG